MRRRLLTFVILVFMAGSPGAQAHHSLAGFFTLKERTVAIEGRLESYLHESPHVFMKIRTADAILYTITWNASTWVQRRAGVTKSTFQIGDHLIVTGAPSRDSKLHEVAHVTEIRRPKDQWVWRLDDLRKALAARAKRRP
jgi:hypothetical protein